MKKIKSDELTLEYIQSKWKVSNEEHMEFLIHLLRDKLYHMKADKKDRQNYLNEIRIAAQKVIILADAMGAKTIELLNE